VKDAGGHPSLAQRLRSHSGAWRLAVAAAIGTAIGGIAAAVGPPTVHRLEPLLWGWVSFCAVTLLMAAFVVMHSPPRLRGVEHEDPSSLVLLVLVLVGCVSSLGAVGAVLLDLNARAPQERLAPGLLAAATVALSWLLIHVRFAFHYAHRFVSWQRHDQTAPLLFPGDQAPDYGDFLYFSFVIGMTSQVSDVQIVSRTMRRLVLWHSLLAFAFNLLILALGVNAIASAL
jgi:uncharacterized membrane protein